jgi:hypothetical protein
MWGQINRGFNCRIIQIQGRRGNLVANGQNAENRLDRASGPSKCPMADLVEDMVAWPAALPKSRSTAASSITSAMVDVPCALM